MNLEELNVYKLAMVLGDRLYKIIATWNFFEKDTMGKQLLKAVDSIAANISEGFGRFHYKDSKQFYYYARGSLFETKTWISKIYNRNLIDENLFNEFIRDINILGIKLNNYIKSIGNKKDLEESAQEYE